MRLEKFNKIEPGITLVISLLVVFFGHPPVAAAFETHVGDTWDPWMFGKHRMFSVQIIGFLKNL